MTLGHDVTVNTQHGPPVVSRFARLGGSHEGVPD